MNSKPLFGHTDPLLFESEFGLDLDPTKKNILIYIAYRVDEYSHVNGQFKLIIDAISEDVNIIVIADKNIGVTYPNHLKLNKKVFDNIKDSKFLRKHENNNSPAINTQILLDEFKKSFKNIPIQKFIIADNDVLRLPLTSYIGKTDDILLHQLMNEFFDYTGNDKDRIKLIKKYTSNLNKNFNSKISILAFSMWRTNFYYNLAKYLDSTGDLEEIILFTIDPIIYSDVYRNLKAKITNYSFVDDTRGTRKYSEYPMPQLQHIIYEGLTGKTPTNLTKSKDFIFAGSILYEKGDRIKVWSKFLSKLKLNNSTIYIPLRMNGIYFNAKSFKRGANSRDKATTKFPKLIEEIKSHPNFRGDIMPVDLLQELAKYKYGFVARVIAHYDSVNFRPVMYINLNVLPLLDYMYDPEYSSIPKHIQDKIVVHNSDDIAAKIEYFNHHDDERLEIIEQLKEIFKFEDIKNNWKNIIKDKIL